MMKKSMLGIFASVFLAGSMAIPVLAQTPGGSGGGSASSQGGGGGGGGGQNYRQQMIDHLKDDMGSSDDEFAALQPKIEAVMSAQRDSMTFFMRGGRRGQGGNGGGPQGPQSDVQIKAADLRTTLENKDATPEEIKEKLDALRQARTKAREDLAKAQADLKELLTARQEAVLVGYGMLE
jgi:hypothetical protein